MEARLLGCHPPILQHVEKSIDLQPNFDSACTPTALQSMRATVGITVCTYVCGGVFGWRADVVKPLARLTTPHQSLLFMLSLPSSSPESAEAALALWKPALGSSRLARP